MDIAGPLSISADQLAVLVSGIFGSDIKTIHLTEEHQERRYIAKGMPPSMAKGLAKAERLVAQGTMDVIGDECARLTGKDPISPSQFLAAQREVFFLNR